MFHRLFHYANMSVQYTAIFVKNDNFQMIVFPLIFAQNIIGGSNEYPQSMFWGKNKKRKYTPVNPSFTI